MNKKELIVDRKNYSNSEITSSQLEALSPGEVLMKIDKFSITSNNITYAIVGDQIGYWNFFPASEGKGIIPVWGFADVIDSKHEALKVGERFYGYFPMGTHLKVSPVKASPYGFIDGVIHRQALPPIYNYYTNTKEDGVYTQESEALQCLLRPLFTTSFLIDDQFGDNNFYDSQNIILTSASSKTGLALAHLLKQRKDNGADINIVGLTSTRNVDFVNGSGYYDLVLPYDKLSDLDKNVNSSIVDFAGNHKLQYDLQIYLGDQLKYNCLVGVVHWDQLRGQERLPKKGEFFFAPTYAQKRQKDWGREGFQSRLKSAWNGFLPHTDSWMDVDIYKGSEDLQQVYSKMLSGKFDPKVGYIIEPN